MAVATLFRAEIPGPAESAGPRDITDGPEPREAAMKRKATSPAPVFLARRSTEVYCRRDNRVYPSCPHGTADHPCPCLHELETADGLFEPVSTEEESLS
jgi:hypothetical protein